MMRSRAKKDSKESKEPAPEPAPAPAPAPAAPPKAASPKAADDPNAVKHASVPGYEKDGLSWQDTPEVVTITMPISGDNLRSLAVRADGSTLSLSWDRGSVSGGLAHERRLARAGGGHRGRACDVEVSVAYMPMSCASVSRRRRWWRQRREEDRRPIQRIPNSPRRRQCPTSPPAAPSSPLLSPAGGD